MPKIHLLVDEVYISYTPQKANNSIQVQTDRVGRGDKQHTAYFPCVVYSPVQTLSLGPQLFVCWEPVHVGGGGRIIAALPDARVSSILSAVRETAAVCNTL
jgi:hypothetical protein